MCICSLLYAALSFSALSLPKLHGRLRESREAEAAVGVEGVGHEHLLRFVNVDTRIYDIEKDNVCIYTYVCRDRDRDRGR